MIYYLMILYKVFFFLGLVKFHSSSSMVLSLISIELMMIGSFSLLISKFWFLISIYSISIFLVIMVIEGVIGLMLIVSIFRDSEMKMSSSLFF